MSLSEPVDGGCSESGSSLWIGRKRGQSLASIWVQMGVFARIFWTPWRFPLRKPIPKISALPVLSNCELLLENWRSSADPLPFQRDIYFNTVGDLDEGNAPVHAVVFAIEGHSAVDAP